MAPAPSYDSIKKVRRRMLEGYVRDKKAPKRAKDEDVIWMKEHAVDLYEDYVKELEEKGIKKPGESILVGGDDTVLNNVMLGPQVLKSKPGLIPINNQSQSARPRNVTTQSEEIFHNDDVSGSIREPDPRSAKRRRMEQIITNGPIMGIAAPNLELMKTGKFSSPIGVVLFRDEIPSSEVIIGFVRNDPAPQRIATAWIDPNGGIKFHIRNTHVDFIARPPDPTYETILESKRWTFVKDISDLDEIEIDFNIDGDRLDHDSTVREITQFVLRHSRDNEA